MNALVTIGSYGDLMVAELVRGRLESEGIDAFVVDDLAALSEGGTVMTQGVRLRVAQDRAEEARRILAEIEGQAG